MRQALHAKAFGRGSGSTASRRTPGEDGVEPVVPRAGGGGRSRRGRGAAVRTISRRLAAFGAKDLVVRNGVVEGCRSRGGRSSATGRAPPRCRRLREVRLVAVQPFMTELARCPHLAAIRRLDLSGNRIGAAGVQRTGRVAVPRRAARTGAVRERPRSGRDRGSARRALVAAVDHASNSPTTGWGRARLEALSKCENLVELDVSRNPLGAAGAEAFARSGLLAADTAPDRIALRLQCGGERRSFTRSQFESLTDLDLSFNDIGPDGQRDRGRRLARASDRPQSRLQRHRGRRARRGTGRCHRVVVAPLARTSPRTGSRPRGVAALSASTNLCSLDELKLTANPIARAASVQSLHRRTTPDPWSKWPSTFRRSTTTPRPATRRPDARGQARRAQARCGCILPKHKASEKVQAELKTKISELNDEIEHAKSGAEEGGPGTLQDSRSRAPGRSCSSARRTPASRVS